MSLFHLQRTRQTPSIRRLFAEHTLKQVQFIQPIFVHEGLTEARAILSLPGIYQHSLSGLPAEIDSLWNTGVRAILLFGIPLHKDATGSQASKKEGIVQNAIRQIKAQYPDMVVMADCCLCEYTSHGHCGIPSTHATQKQMHFQHKASLQRLQEIAVSYAEAGVDIIAPSGMLDGMIGHIRAALDTAEYTNTLLLSYAVKYASAFYGPFREAAGSSNTFTGDRRHHQMNPAQKKEALREALADIAEGADALMVKPGMPYLDILAMLRQETILPLAAYQVSGEYAMLHAGAKAGLFDYEDAFLESLMGFVRAGANWIITYDAKTALRTIV